MAEAGLQQGKVTKQLIGQPTVAPVTIDETNEFLLQCDWL
jgi:hypothetical protein